MQREYTFKTISGNTVKMLADSVLNNWLPIELWSEFDFDMSLHDSYNGKVYHNCSFVGDDWFGYFEDEFVALIDPSHFMYISPPSVLA